MLNTKDPVKVSLICLVLEEYCAKPVKIRVIGVSRREYSPTHEAKMLLPRDQP